MSSKINFDISGKELNKVLDLLIIFCMYGAVLNGHVWV